MDVFKKTKQGTSHAEDVVVKRLFDNNIFRTKKVQIQVVLIAQFPVGETGPTWDKKGISPHISHPLTRK
jgi:hypothetical protein